MIRASQLIQRFHIDGGEREVHMAKQARRCVEVERRIDKPATLKIDVGQFGVVEDNLPNLRGNKARPRGVRHGGEPVLSRRSLLC